MDDGWRKSTALSEISVQGTEVSFCDDEAGMEIARVMGEYSCWLILSQMITCYAIPRKTDRDFQALQLKR